MKTRILKILTAAAGVALVLILTVLPALAMTINVTVTYLGAEGYSTGFYFKTSDQDNYTQYEEGEGPQAVYSDFTCSAYIGLSTAGVQSGYTGFLIYLTEGPVYTMYQNLVPTMLDTQNIVPLADGSYYVEAGDVFLFTKTTGFLYLYAAPVNYDNYISNLSQYDYERGKREGLAEQQARINELESTIAVLYDDQTSLGEQLSEAFENGRRQESAQYNYVTGVFTETINGVGKLMDKMFNLKILNIYVYQIALLAAAVPLTIFLVKICIHH